MDAIVKAEENSDQSDEVEILHGLERIGHGRQLFPVFQCQNGMLGTGKSQKRCQGRVKIGVRPAQQRQKVILQRGIKRL